MRPFLDGVRILDFSTLLPGPYGTTMLADLGAEVIKIEHPDGGDPIRHREPLADDRSYTHLTRNRSKKSIAIDLKADGGREAFLDLAKTADVVVEQFRPGVVDRLGVGYEDVREVNDDIVYCSLSGYGQDGPYADRPGHDINYIGVAGLLAMTGERDRRPVPPGYPIADFVGGLYVALGVAAAVAGVRAGTGGDYLDISMTDTVASFGMTYLDRQRGGADSPRRQETHLTGSHPGYGVYEAGDGQLLSLGALEKRFWDGLCEALETPEFKDDHADPNRPLSDDRRAEIIATFEDRLGNRSRSSWLERFDEFDVPAAPVNEFDEMLDDPHLRARETFESQDLPDAEETLIQSQLPIKFDGDRRAPSSPAPRLGADTAQLLSEAGYDDASIAELVEAGAVALEQDC